MSFLLDPVIRYCSFCQAEWARATEAEAERDKANHEALRHNQPMPTQELAGSDWQSQALDAVRKVAARGANFTVFAALREFGIADPPNAKTALGKFSTLMHDMGVAHPVGYGPSKRPGTKASAAAVWNRNGANCTSERCRIRAGAA